MPSPFSTEFVSAQKLHLLQLRESITGITPDEIQSVKGDFCDVSQYAFEHEFALSLLAKSSNSLKMIDKALSKIAEGTYGVCEISGKPIAIERLEALPWAEGVAVDNAWQRHAPQNSQYAKGIVRMLVRASYTLSVSCHQECSLNSYCCLLGLSC